MLVSTKLSGILKHKELFTCKWYKKPWWTYQKIYKGRSGYLICEIPNPSQN